MVALGTYNRHYNTVFENGGDPNLKSDSLIYGNRSPLQLISYAAPDAVERLRLLVENGGNLDELDEQGLTFVCGHARGAAQSEMLSRLVLEALNLGADFRQHYMVKDCSYRLIHFLAESEAMATAKLSKDQRHFRELIAWLEAQWESLSEAKADLKRWQEWKQENRVDLIEKEYQERIDRDSEKDK